MPGKTKIRTYGIWLDYMEELSTARDLLLARGETEISSNIVFAVVCGVCALCAHDLRRLRASHKGSDAFVKATSETIAVTFWRFRAKDGRADRFGDGGDWDRCLVVLLSQA